MAQLTLVLMLALSLQTVFFWLLVYLVKFFLITGHTVLGKTNCYKWAFGNVVVRRGGREVILWSYD